MKNKSLILALFATIIQYYDYALFGLSASILTEQYIPDSDIAPNFLSFFGILTFAVVMRPVGSIIFGKIGDKLGRSFVIKISIFLAAISTLLVGIIPSGQTIISASLLIFTRMIFMMSLAGEGDGVRIYVAETIGLKREFFGNGLVSSSSQIGVLIASSMYFLSCSGIMPEYWWRMNFIIGGACGIILLYFRNSMEESKEFAFFMSSSRRRGSGDCKLDSSLRASDASEGGNEGVLCHPRENGDLVIIDSRLCGNDKVECHPHSGLPCHPLAGPPCHPLEGPPCHPRENGDLVINMYSHFKTIITGIVIMGFIGGIYHFYVIFYGSYLSSILGVISKGTMSKIHILSMILYIFGSILSGYVADKYNPYRQVLIGLFLSFILAVIGGIFIENSYVTILLFFLSIAIIPFYTVPLQIMFKRKIDITHRLKIFSISHSFGSLFFSSSSALISGYLWHISHKPFMPILYAIIMIGIVFGAVIISFKEKEKIKKT